MHEDFLLAIRENPESDAPRLVYADWFKENGDDVDRVHTQLIQMQCAIAGILLLNVRT